MIFSSAALIMRGIISLLIVIQYENIKKICQQIFLEDDVGERMAL
jgi:hypothetical protein